MTSLSAAFAASLPKTRQAAAAEAKGRTQTSPADETATSSNARNVIVVPGYGHGGGAGATMPSPSAGNILRERGIDAKYAHPSLSAVPAMPGHIDVLARRSQRTLTSSFRRDEEIIILPREADIVLRCPAQRRPPNQRRRYQQENPAPNVNAYLECRAPIRSSSSIACMRFPASPASTTNSITTKNA